MQYRSIRSVVAKVLGAIANRFFRMADWLDADYDDEWNRIRDAVRRRYAELDQGWGDKIDWGDCQKPHDSVRFDQEQTETCTNVDLPQGTFTNGVLRRRSDPPPRGQA